MRDRMPTTLPARLGVAEADAAAEILKAIGHPLRLRILSLLAAEAEHVKGIATRLGTPPAVVSQQLRILRSAGLVSASTRSGHAYYRIIEPQLRSMLHCVETCVKGRSVRGEP